MSDHEPMLPVSADRPCPACGKSDWCLIRDDGKKGICSRVQSPHKAGDAGWFHVYEDEPLPPKANGRRKTKSAKSAAAAPVTPPPPADRPHKAGKNKLPPSHWQADVERFAARVTPEHLATLAGSLGVPPSALSSFPLVGFCSVVSMLPTFSCPETDAGGRVVGYVERFPKGKGREVQGKYLEKITPTGSDRGLTIPAGLAERSGPLFCVEAFSDTVAMTAAGTACVGRPFNNGGAELLTQFCREVPADRPIVIVGEHDRKPDGRWPGKEGMEVIADHLKRELKRPILTALPPDGAKDVRAWLTDPARGEMPWDERGAELSAKLMAAAANPVPVNQPASAVPTAELTTGSDPNQWGKKPEDQHRLADAYLQTVTPPGSPSRLRYWLGEFHEWAGGCYHTVSVATFRARLTDWISREFERVHQLEMVAWQAKSADSGRGERPKVKLVPTHLVSAVVGAIGGRCHIPDVVETVNPPLWLDGFDGPDPRDIVPLPNALVHVPTGRVMPPTPSFFSFAVAPFQYDPNAPQPVAWIKAIRQYFKGDIQSIECLQEMMGLFLTGQTQYQRQLMIIGGSRSGKGTTLRVVQALIGKQSYASTTLTSLAGDFGLEGLVGKTLAVISDMLVSNKADYTAAVERMLNIIGEDDVTINPKGKKQFTQRMPLRFLTACNEPPELENASGALANRTIVLEMDNPFVGHEDPTVEAGIMRELPSILLWAMEGFRRLRARTRFVQPAISASRLDQFRRIGSKHEVFVNERCVVEDGAHVPKQELFEAWQKWCKDTNYKGVGDAEDFGRKLRATVRRLKPGVEFRSDYRPRVNGTPTRSFKGIRLRSVFESEDYEDANGSGSGQKTAHDDSSRFMDVITLNGTHQAGLIQGDPGVIQASDDVNHYQIRTDPTDPTDPGISLPPIHAREKNGNASPARIGATKPPGSHGSVGSTPVNQGFSTGATWISPGSPWISPDEWLYVSKKLELTTLPATQLLEVVQLGGTSYHRISPAVVVWLEHAIAALDAGTPPPPPDVVREVIAAQSAIYTFARERFADGELDAARADAVANGVQPLPDGDLVR